jgi:hypothetical protein
MERELFDWEDWEPAEAEGNWAILFYNVVLKKDIGKYPSGTRLNAAMIEFQQGTLELYENTNEGPTATFNLHLHVGERIND